MQAELLDDPFDTADTQGQIGLGEFLRDDGGGRFGIEETMADDLPDDFVGAAVIAFGAALFARQGGGPALLISVAELEIALFTEAEIAGGLERSAAMAFAVDKHSEFAGYFIVGGHKEVAGGTAELALMRIEVQHVQCPLARCGG